MRPYVEPSPAGGYFVRLRGEPAPVSRHDTEEEAEAAAAAYQRGLARADTSELVTLRDGGEVELRASGGPDDAAVTAFDEHRRPVGAARYARDAQRLHVAALTLELAEGWRDTGLEDQLLRRLRERAAENGIRELT